MTKDEILNYISSNFEEKDRVDINPRNIKINPDGTVDVNGDVMACMIFMNQVLEIQFGTVTGNFTIKGMAHLKTLVGCPSQVGGSFSCINNQITTLEGGPISVGGDYDVSQNAHLISLNGLPKTVKGTLRVTWTDKIGLLRLVRNEIKAIDLLNAPDPVTKIIKKYFGKTTSGARNAAALQCSLELMRAGFKNNARQ